MVEDEKLVTALVDAMCTSGILDISDSLNQFTFTDNKEKVCHQI